MSFGPHLPLRIGSLSGIRARCKLFGLQLIRAALSQHWDRLDTAACTYVKRLIGLQSNGSGAGWALQQSKAAQEEPTSHRSSRSLPR